MVLNVLITQLLSIRSLRVEMDIMIEDDIHSSIIKKETSEGGNVRNVTISIFNQYTRYHVLLSTFASEIV
jgi:hypothetical protein